MNKPFKTFEEQINILKGRNLVIENDEYVKEILSQINYYNTIILNSLKFYIFTLL